MASRSTVQNVEPQLFYLHGLLPKLAFTLIEERVHDLVVQPSSQLGIRLVVGPLVTFWSAGTGVKSLLPALNVANDFREQRGFPRFQPVSLGMTLASMLIVALAIAILVFIPVVISFLGLQVHTAGLIHAAAMVMLVAFVSTSVAVLYRIGPSRTRGQCIMRGTVLATSLWLLASILLTFYITNFQAAVPRMDPSLLPLP
jgi:membrane protein